MIRLPPPNLQHMTYMIPHRAHPPLVNLYRDPAPKDLFVSTVSSTFNSSYFRYISCRNLHMLSTIIQSVLKVENTLFQVLRNGFNVPGTTFEAMFKLPHTPTDIDSNSLEGSNLENPIHLPGIKAAHFRSFLRILYPL